jgi:formylglycine-generating enzyme required for sulfatase activity
MIFPILFFFLSCSDNPPGMVMIPKGKFTLGINPDNKIIQFMSDATLSLNAQPAQKIYTKSFYIDQLEVTYEAFHRFKPKFEYETKNPSEPIRGVNWFEADAYCLSQSKRLPTEIEWEKAARGTDGRLFVWGEEFIQKNANFSSQVRPIKSIPSDTSSYGVVDLNGNVSEWTASWYNPYKNSKFKDSLYGKKVKVIRGGSFHKMNHGLMKEFAILPYRNFAPPQDRFWDTGFRCAQST